MVLTAVFWLTIGVLVGVRLGYSSGRLDEQYRVPAWQPFRAAFQRTLRRWGGD